MIYNDKLSKLNNTQYGGKALNIDIGSVKKKNEEMFQDSQLIQSCFH